MVTSGAHQHRRRLLFKEELRSLKASTTVVLLIRTKLNKALAHAAFKRPHSAVKSKNSERSDIYSLGKDSEKQKNQEKQQQLSLWKSPDCLKSRKADVFCPQTAGSHLVHLQTSEFLLTPDSCLSFFLCCCCGCRDAESFFSSYRCCRTFFPPPFKIYFLISHPIQLLPTCFYCLV